MPHICDVHVKKEVVAQFGEWLRQVRKNAEEAMKWALWVLGELFNGSVHDDMAVDSGGVVTGGSSSHVAVIAVIGVSDHPPVPCAAHHSVQ